MNLTDRVVANLKPHAERRREVFDDDVPGLAIRVNQGGSKSWVLFYRERVPDASGGFVAGKRQVRWTMGTYPTLSLKEARTKAKRALNELATKGVDPATGKREARSGRTFGDLADDYLNRHAKKHKRSWADDERTLNVDVLPHWSSRPVKSITRRNVHDLIDLVVDRGSPVMANRLLALVSGVFSYGLSKDWIEGNPAARIPKQPEASRTRVLTDEEIVSLWNALDAAKTAKRTTEATKAPAVSPMIARGLQMILVTAQRPGEAFSMRWEDVDLANKWWTIPAAKSKNGEAHRVPLTARAVELIEEARKFGPKDNAWVFAGTQGANVAARAKKAAAKLRKADVIDFDFHRHDLRRTAATGMAKAGVSRATIAQVLNHVDGGARATVVYDRYSYDAEKRAALNKWGRRLEAILENEADKRVVAFSGRKRART